MRTTIIPAQITTVEDTIAGNLTLTQILLLLAPVLVATGIYAVLPEKMSFSVYKIVLTIFISFVFTILAIRVKGKIVLSWLGILLTYFSRPKFYFFDKNNSYARDEIIIRTKTKSASRQAKSKKLENQNTEDLLDFDYQKAIRDTEVNLRFTKKGLLLIKNL